MWCMLHAAHLNGAEGCGSIPSVGTRGIGHGDQTDSKPVKERVRFLHAPSPSGVAVPLVGGVSSCCTPVACGGPPGHGQLAQQGEQFFYTE